MSMNYVIKPENMNLSRYIEWPLSEIFWLRKEKKSDYPLYKDFVHVFEVLYKNKTRIVIRKQS